MFSGIQNYRVQPGVTVMPTAPRVDPNAFVQQPVDFGGAIDSFARGLDRGRQIKRQKEMDAEAKRIQKLNEERQALEDEQRKIENARREEERALRMQRDQLVLDQMQVEQEREKAQLAVQEEQLAKLEMDTLEAPRGEDGRIAVPTDENGIPSDPRLATLRVLDDFYTQQPTEGAEFMSVVLPPEALTVYQEVYSNITKNITEQKAALASFRAAEKTRQEKEALEAKKESEKYTTVKVSTQTLGDVEIPAVMADNLARQAASLARDNAIIIATSQGVRIPDDDGRQILKVLTLEEAEKMYPKNWSPPVTDPLYKTAYEKLVTEAVDDRASLLQGFDLDGREQQSLAKVPTDVEFRTEVVDGKQAYVLSPGASSNDLPADLEWYTIEGRANGRAFRNPNFKGGGENSILRYDK